MDILLHKLDGLINGVIEGFDRIVFKGTLKPIAYAAGMAVFLGRINVLNKEYKNWAENQSKAIVGYAEQYAFNQSEIKIQYLPSYRIRKEEVAHKQQAASGIQSGLVGVWSCVESCKTYHAVYDKNAGFPQLQHKNSRCKHLYFYYDHEDFGFMSIRLQTWAPYEIQIALNGREWLRRQLDKAGIKYVVVGNKFLHIDDYDKAQSLLAAQLDTRWIDVLDRLAAEVFPSMREIFGEHFGYTWILWQSEWAKDYIFSDPQSLDPIMNNVTRHAFLTGTYDRILGYMGRPLSPNGQPHHASKPDLRTRCKKWHNGARIRHYLDDNSVKLYNEQNVLRFEFTMNNPAKFRVYRTVEGRNDGEKKFLPMRKGIADINVRTQICSARLKNFTEHLATFRDDTSFGDLISMVSKPVTAAGKRHRALDITGKDRELLLAIADPKYNADAITNKHLQGALSNTEWTNGLTGKQLSGRISRNLRLLREHRLIKKLPNQHRYMLTEKGRLLTIALSQLLGVKINDLTQLVA
ncbi:MAG: hypothetical protein LBH21_03700 [Gracilibacteraceae bacterium]|jgi:hypothetical protein|nr:hypothetical protein [Gracilibacteraceae bacterium]